MSRWWGAGVVLAAVTSTAAAQEDGGGQALHRFELANGLEVVVVENHAAPLATVLVVVRGGAAVQAKGEEGLAHLFEHLLFRSYDDRPAAFATAAADINAFYNGTTSDELVDYYLMLPSANAEKGIRLLGRLFTRAKFRAEDLEEERAVVLDELERRQSDPEQALVRAAAKELWGEAWHRRDVGGDSASLMAISADQLTANFARYYVPNNAALIVTGDVSPAGVHAAAERHFRRWKQADDPFEEGQFTPISALTGSRATIVAKDMRDVTIHIKLQGPSLREDPEATYAADVLFEILNDPRSHFQQQLVESGLFQGLGSSYLTLSEVGPIAIAGKTSVTDAHDALLALIAQIDSLDHLLGITDLDLAIAKKRREVGAALTLEAAATLAPSLAFWWAGAGIDYYATYGERMNAQTLDDLRQFAREYLVNQPKVLGVLGPNTAMTEIADWLRKSSGNP